MATNHRWNSSTSHARSGQGAQSNATNRKAVGTEVLRTLGQRAAIEERAPVQCQHNNTHVVSSGQQPQKALLATLLHAPLGIRLAPLEAMLSVDVVNRSAGTPPSPAAGELGITKRNTICRKQATSWGAHWQRTPKHCDKWGGQPMHRQENKRDIGSYQMQFGRGLQTPLNKGPITLTRSTSDPLQTVLPTDAQPTPSHDRGIRTRDAGLIQICVPPRKSKLWDGSTTRGLDRHIPQHVETLAQS